MTELLWNLIFDLKKKSVKNSLMLAKRLWGALEWHSPRVCKSTEGEEQKDLDNYLVAFCVVFFSFLSFTDKASSKTHEFIVG